jgi:hypothetical protein
LELRDGDKDRYGGRGVQRAVQAVIEQIAPELAWVDAWFCWTVTSDKYAAKALETLEHDCSETECRRWRTGLASPV